MYLRVDNFGNNSLSKTAFNLNAQDKVKSQSFEEILADAYSSLAELDKNAIDAQLELLSGNSEDLHTAILAIEKQSLALDLVISVRNKAVEAYQEIMRMPL